MQRLIKLYELKEQDHDDMEYMTRKLEEEYEKWGLAIHLETKTNMYSYVYVWEKEKKF